MVHVIADNDCGESAGEICSGLISIARSLYNMLQLLVVRSVYMVQFSILKEAGAFETILILY